MTTMAKKRKRNHVKKLARLAANDNNVNNNSYTPRPETPVEDTDCETPRSITPIMSLKHTGRMSPEDMLGPPPLMEFKEMSPAPLGPQRKRRKTGKANGTSPPRRKRHTSRPAHKPKKPRSAYQFFVKERWQGRLSQIKINQPGNKDRKRMQKETKIFARLWKVRAVSV